MPLKAEVSDMNPEGLRPVPTPPPPLPLLPLSSRWPIPGNCETHRKYTQRPYKISLLTKQKQKDGFNYSTKVATPTKSGKYTMNITNSKFRDGGRP